MGWQYGVTMVPSGELPIQSPDRFEPLPLTSQISKGIFSAPTFALFWTRRPFLTTVLAAPTHALRS